MQSYNVDVATADGAMNCFVAHPDGDELRSSVILYMDVPGIREELRDFARHIAGAGYLCILPDLYYREGKVRFDLTNGESELQKMFAIGSTLTNAMIVSDTRGIVNYIDGLDMTTDRIGTIGYCMSGQFVISVAGSFPEQISATASLYGTRMVTDKPDSPHLLIPQIQGEVYLGFAAHDPYVEDHVPATLKDALQANNITFELETFDNTEHGFCFPARPAYNQQAAEQVWNRVFAMFDRQL